MSNLVHTLLNRASHAANTLVEPVPSDEQLKQILGCALSAPDHGKLRPWRFVVIQGQSRHKLGDALATAAKAADPEITNEKLDTIRSKPFRAPLLIAVLVEIVEDLPKVPVFEQILSTGAAAQQLQLAANALDFGCVWLSGPHCNGVAVKELFNAAEKDLVAGFIYMGTASLPAPAKPRPAVEDRVQFLDE